MMLCAPQIERPKVIDFHGRVGVLSPTASPIDLTVMRASLGISPESLLPSQMYKMLDSSLTLVDN